MGFQGREQRQDKTTEKELPDNVTRFIASKNRISFSPAKDNNSFDHKKFSTLLTKKRRKTKKIYYEPNLTRMNENILKKGDKLISIN